MPNEETEIKTINDTPKYVYSSTNAVTSTFLGVFDGINFHKSTGEERANKKPVAISGNNKNVVIKNPQNVNFTFHKFEFEDITGYYFTYTPKRA